MSMKGDVTYLQGIIVLFFFQDAVQAIAATAFQASDYPVILSFENHCNRNNQEKMAKYTAKAFKEMLLKECLPKYPVIASKL